MDAVLTCLVSERVGPGEMNQKLSQLAREYFGADGAAAFRSPSLALLCAFAALDLPPGSGVIISALAPRWHYLTIKRAGYLPVIIDVDVETALLNAAGIEEGVRRGGRVVLLHETLGYLPDLPAIIALGIPVIEDISQSAGAQWDERKAGLFGVFSILGLEERDVLTAGGGALLLAPNRREAIVMKRLVEEGPATDILPDINSALGWVQLKELQRNIEIRKEMNTLYVRSLMQGRHKTMIQQGGETVQPAIFSFPVILASGLKEVRQYVSRKEIEVELAFEDSLPALTDVLPEECANARSLYLRCVLFPLYPRLGNANAAKIAKVLATLP